MKRAIVIPALLPPAALAELKQWLGITTTIDDAPLTSLLRASLDTCEAFTGILPLDATCEETVAARGETQALSVRPVQAVTAVAALAVTGARSPLSADAYSAQVDADGGGTVRVTAPVTSGRAIVTYTAGLSASWDALPDALRHGIVRLAAHQHREREGSGAAPMPPSSVAALWRPWRRLRLT